MDCGYGGSRIQRNGQGEPCSGHYAPVIESGYARVDGDRTPAVGLGIKCGKIVEGCCRPAALVDGDNFSIVFPARAAAV